ncbi:MAG: amino acid ABC transporter permease [Caldimonas sp.]
MTSLGAADLSPDRFPLKLAPQRHYVQVVAAVVVLLLAFLLARSLALNDNMQWGMVWKYLGNTQVRQGIVTTIGLTVLCMVMGTILATILAVMRLSNNRVLSTVSFAYTWVFRGTPLLVQLIFWYNLAALFPVLSIGIPFTDIHAGVSTNTVITPFIAAVLGFTLNEAAYMSEIVRAGIQSVNIGQREAALSTGMTEGQSMTHIVLPQALRVIVPPTANQAINLLKATSLVAFIAGDDLLSAVQNIYAVNFAVIPLLVVASIWYLIIVSVASVGQYYLEHRVGRGVTNFNPAAMTDQITLAKAAPGQPSRGSPA